MDAIERPPGRTANPDDRRHGSSAQARGPTSLRTLYYVAAAVLAALIPLIVFAGLWVRSELDKNRRDIEGHLASRAAALTSRLDGQIRQDIAVLTAIGRMPALDRPNLESFRRTATRMVAAMPNWVGVALVDPTDGRQILNTLRPPGVDLPETVEPELVRQVAQTRRPAVETRLAGWGSLYPERAILILVPAGDDAGPRYVMAAITRADAVQTAVASSRTGQGPLETVIDAKGLILARSLEPETSIGRPIGEAFMRGAADRRMGSFEATTLEGERVLTVFQRSLTTGWLTSVATDLNRLNALGDRSRAAMLAAGLLALTLAVVLSVFLLHNLVQHRVGEERLMAARALNDLDARLLATSERSLADQRRASSEREVLLREIYHRVKNNLQIVQSLLRLGSRNLNPEQREPFENAVRRIGAMARVHTLLYKSPDLSSIDLKDYLDEFVPEIAADFLAQTRGIQTVLDAQPMLIPLDTAVPLAFIVAELLTNAFKHAFPPGRTGTVTVRAVVEDDRGVLTVSDDGVGFQDTSARRGALGLTMVSRLVEQIGGTLTMPAPGETAIRVGFPLGAAVPPAGSDPSAASGAP